MLVGVHVTFTGMTSAATLPNKAR